MPTVDYTRWYREIDWVRYRKIKAAMKLGYVDRGDFLFVKGIDQRTNARNSVRAMRVFRDNVASGYGNKRSWGAR
jgi:hypothetical protein